MTIPRSITRLTLEERETYLRTTDLPRAGWELWTLSPAWADKLKRMGLSPQPDRQGGWKVTLEPRQVVIHNRAKRRISEATMANLAKANLARQVSGAAAQAEIEKRKP